MAAVAAYPELCVTRDTAIRVNPGSSFAKWFKGGFEMYVDNTLNPADEHVYSFLDKVFGEVIHKVLRTWSRQVMAAMHRCGNHFHLTLNMGRCR
jgi:hypothetical protein